MKHIFFGLLAASALIGGLTSCSSDNTDELYVPQKVAHTMTLDVESDVYANGKLSFGAAPGRATVKVESNTRWAAEVIGSTGGWCDIDAYSGSNGGTFTISVRENLSETRNCIVRVYMTDSEGNITEDGSQDISVSQEASNVRLSPSSLEPFAAANPEPKNFEIIANAKWTLSLTYDYGSSVEFVTIHPEQESMTLQPDGTYSGENNARFSITLEPNRTSAQRTAIMTLKSEVGTYSITITQLGSEYTFDVSPLELQTVPVEGGEVTFYVLSLSGWKVSTSAVEWIKFEPSAGEGSDEPTRITAMISPNTTGAFRTAEIRFIPDNSNYPGQSVIINQLWDMPLEPAISIPWLLDGFTQHTAMVAFNYYSPFESVKMAGIDWKKENADEWYTKEVNVENATAGTVFVELDELESASNYVIRGFVVYGEGNIKYGDWSFPFNTAGKVPGSDDNPTPDVNR